VARPRSLAARIHVDAREALHQPEVFDVPAALAGPIRLTPDYCGEGARLTGAKPEPIRISYESHSTLSRGGQGLGRPTLLQFAREARRKSATGKGPHRHSGFSNRAAGVQKRGETLIASSSGLGFSRRHVGAVPTTFSRPALVALPGPRRRTDGAGGLQRHGAGPGSPARAARGRSTSATAFRTSPADTAPSRAAVIAVTSRGDASPQGAATPCGLTASAADNRLTSAGQAQACLADIPAAVAVDAANSASVSRTNDRPSSLAVSPWSRASATDRGAGTRGAPTPQRVAPTQTRALSTKEGHAHASQRPRSSEHHRPDPLLDRHCSRRGSRCNRRNHLAVLPRQDPHVELVHREPSPRTFGAGLRFLSDAVERDGFRRRLGLSMAARTDFRLALPATGQHSRAGLIGNSIWPAGLPSAGITTQGEHT
jgi:hypothetical protein